MGLLLIATGDTLAHLDGAVATGADLLAGLSVPADDVVAEDVLAEPSWDTSPGTMLGIARRVAGAHADGVVVTHGLDTLEQTALLTELIARPRCPVVFTGARLGFDVPGSDGPPNLTAALAAARSARAGVFVCRDGVVTRPWSASFPVVAGDPESDVALIKVYPGIPPSLLHTVVDAGARGVVIEATGAGNVPVGLFTAINELTGWGIPVVVASRDEVPRETRGATALVLSVGAISGRMLSPELARVALMYALGGGGVDAVRKWFAHL
ncbi:asparaginase [Labedaea rhizosphaerae]|uniref:L-asparaginase n=1 Tax=Labedaea rhizosphaerae TaxID=598644 RepID=A0A4R6S8E2_LABRH|nr:asparaginase [Labedaea rhizosphaerae]TDP95126.1 L-asparaginase [Labedaea rhizosphaerae]